MDAALDLSHTQNIGRMIRTHFPYSQFIVVSLKEGMFNNANVIFRTKARATRGTARAPARCAPRLTRERTRSLWTACPPSCAPCRR